MTGPKAFTGPEGYTFRIDGEAVQIATPDGHPDDQESFIDVPLADLNAFVAWRGQHHGQHVRCLDCLRSPTLALGDTPDERQARAEARRQAYAGSTAERSIDDGENFPAGTRAVSIACPRCKGTTWVPTEEPEGGLLRADYTVQHPCPDCTKWPDRGSGCAHHARDVGEPCDVCGKVKADPDPAGPAVGRTVGDYDPDAGEGDCACANCASPTYIGPCLRVKPRT